jgi:predicted NACHT family NTPase
MELLNSLVDFSGYIDAFVHDFENFDEYSQGERLPVVENLARCDLFKFYVDLNCYYIDKDEDKEDIDDSKEQRSSVTTASLDGFISEWLDNPKRNYLCVLGDYGTGKSSFCLHLSYILARKYKENPIGSRIPILIPLRDYNKAVDIRQLVTNLLINQYHVKLASYESLKDF